MFTPSDKEWFTIRNISEGYYTGWHGEALPDETLPAIAEILEVYLAYLYPTGEMAEPSNANDLLQRIYNALGKDGPDERVQALTNHIRQRGWG